jgi:Subtilase family
MARGPRNATTSAYALPALRATAKDRAHPYSIVNPGAKAGDDWSVKDICAAYEWPDPKQKQVSGGGKIALIHLAGGWLQADVKKFFVDQGLPGLAPTPTDRSLDPDVKNSKLETPNEADAEVALDVQLAGAAYALATDKPATIMVYWTKDLTAGLVAATADDCDVCCITWGADEQTWGRAADAFNAAARAAVDRGMIIVAASGDNDSSDGGPSPSNVDFPASSPYVIGCGGTTLGKPPKGAKALREEKVWNDEPGDPDGDGTGGGVSEFFPIPDWQLGTLQATRRIVPDVAAHSDPASGYRIVIGGQDQVVGGTSAAAALYAGLFAAFGPKRGFILPELYKNPVCFNDITDGNNGLFRALIGPDACTGLGSPRGARLSERIGSDAATLKRVWGLVRRGIGSGVPCECQSANYAHAPVTLTPRAATAAASPACDGSVALGAAIPARSQIMTRVISQSDNANIPNPSDITPIIPNLMTPGPNPIWQLARNCMVKDSLFAGDHLWIEPDIRTAGTTLGGFVNYIMCCYNFHRAT